MHVNRIEQYPKTIQAKQPAFSAKINLKSSGIAEYCEYLGRCKDAPKGCFSSNRNIDLFSKICKAFEKHPSEEVIETSVIYRIGELFNARGTIETNRGKIIDIEPSRSDDGIGPMEHLFRKLLHPDNKEVFNKLLGEEYSNTYPNWWKENIKPLWNGIRELYKIDNTIKENLSEEKYNKLFRNQFRRKYYSEKRNKSLPDAKQKPKNRNEKVEAKPQFVERLKKAWQILKGK